MKLRRRKFQFAIDFAERVVRLDQQLTNFSPARRFFCLALKAFRDEKQSRQTSISEKENLREILIRSSKISAEKINENRAEQISDAMTRFLRSNVFADDQTLKMVVEFSRRIFVETRSVIVRRKKRRFDGRVRTNFPVVDRSRNENLPDRLIDVFQRREMNDVGKCLRRISFYEIVSIEVKRHFTFATAIRTNDPTMILQIIDSLTNQRRFQTFC